MARVVNSTAFIPTLRFRYKARIVGQAPGMQIYARSVDLPKWTSKSGWANPITIMCYHFEGLTVREVLDINPVDVNLVISIIDPAGIPIYEWNLVGDITLIDYGNVDWGIDDITMLTMVFMPKECNVALELNKKENERK